MSREYTPTTNGLRNRYLWWYEAQQERQPSKFTKYPDEVLAEFDRWLAGLRAEVIREAASKMPWKVDLPGGGVSLDHGNGFERWLRQYADRLSVNAGPE